MSIYNRLDRLMRNRRSRQPGTEATSPSPLPVRLKTAADLLTLLEEQIAAVRGALEAGALERARVVGVLAGVALKAIDAGNLEARVAMLEAVLKQRNPGDKR